MDTERFVGQKVLVELTVKSITEDKKGINYGLGYDKEIGTVYVPSSAIKDTSCKE